MPSKRRHRCLKPGCQVMMPYSKLACPPHWHELPRPLKSAIYANYKPGQTMITASDAYLAAFYAVIDYWTEGPQVPLDGPVSQSERLRALSHSESRVGEVDAF